MYSSYGLITPAPVVRYAVEGGHLILLAEHSMQLLPRKRMRRKGKQGLNRLLLLLLQQWRHQAKWRQPLTHTHTQTQEHVEENGGHMHCMHINNTKNLPRLFSHSSFTPRPTSHHTYVDRRTVEFECV